MRRAIREAAEPLAALAAVGALPVLPPITPGNTRVSQAGPTCNTGGILEAGEAGGGQSFRRRYG